MNKKQLVIMWVAVALIILRYFSIFFFRHYGGFTPMTSVTVDRWSDFAASVLIIGLVGGALIYTVGGKGSGRQ